MREQIIERAFTIQEGSEPLAAYGRYGGGEARCFARPGQAAITSAYTQFSIGVVVDGAFLYRSPAGVLDANPGALLFGNMGQEFTYRFSCEGLVRRAVLALDPELVEQGAEALGVKPVFTTPGLARSRETVRPYGWVRQLALGQPTPEDTLVDLTILALGGDAPSHPLRVSERDRREIAHLADHLNATFSEAWDLTRMAELTGMDRFHLIRAFKQTVGENPRQHLIGARLRAAADRLVETRDPITSIAMEVGFNDISHFNLTFRAAFGKPPRAWRNATETL